MDSLVLAMQHKLKFISSVQYVDTIYCQEDLPRAMTNRDRWQERVKGTCAVCILDDDDDCCLPVEKFKLYLKIPILNVFSQLLEK